MGAKFHIGSLLGKIRFYKWFKEAPIATLLFLLEW